MIEVKSSRSLSIMSLSRLLPICDSIRSKGQGFLLILRDDVKDTVSKAGELEEFEKLHIRAAKTDGDVIEGVLNEFRSFSASSLPQSV